jgi:hypothetical protein
LDYAIGRGRKDVIRLLKEASAGKNQVKVDETEELDYQREVVVNIKMMKLFLS